jgi:CTP-dependent riboflavin kinase
VKLLGKPVEGCKVASASLKELTPRICDISGLWELKPGTLNIRLQHAYEECPDFTLPPCDEHPNESVSFQRCRVLGHDALIMRTHNGKKYHGLEVLEIMSEVNFRDRYTLSEEAEIEVEIE